MTERPISKYAHDTANARRLLLGEGREHPGRSARTEEDGIMIVVEFTILRAQGVTLRDRSEATGAWPPEAPWLRDGLAAVVMREDGDYRTATP